MSLPPMETKKNRKFVKQILTDRLYFFLLSAILPTCSSFVRFQKKKKQTFYSISLRIYLSMREFPIYRAEFGIFGHRNASKKKLISMFPSILHFYVFLATDVWREAKIQQPREREWDSTKERKILYLLAPL